MCILYIYVYIYVQKITLIWCKAWALHESTSEYCILFQIHKGASPDGADHGLSRKVAFDLMTKYLGKSY